MGVNSFSAVSRAAEQLLRDEKKKDSLHAGCRLPNPWELRCLSLCSLLPSSCRKIFLAGTSLRRVPGTACQESKPRDETPNSCPGMQHGTADVSKCPTLGENLTVPVRIRTKEHSTSLFDILRPTYFEPFRAELVLLMEVSFAGSQCRLLAGG